MRLMAITMICHAIPFVAYDRSQVLLLPVAPDGLRGLRDNPVRFIDAWVRLIWARRPLVSTPSPRRSSDGNTYQRRSRGGPVVSSTYTP